MRLRELVPLNELDDQVQYNKTKTGLHQYSVGKNWSVGEVAERPDHMYLMNLDTQQTKRGRGYANNIMKSITNHADSINKSMKLYVQPRDRNTDTDRLRGFYKAHGFESEKHDPNQMFRSKK